MTDRAKPVSGKRRVFLKAAIAAGSAAAISGVSAAPAIESEPPQVKPDPDAEPATGGYRETSHIREYYKTLRE